MKKLFYLLVPLLALFLTLVPQFARAEVGNIDDYLIQPFTIEFASSDYQQYLSIYTNNTYNTTVVTIDLEYRMATDDGDFGAWTRLATKGITTSTQLYNATQTAFTLAASHSYKIQLRGNNPESFCKSNINYQILPQCRTASSKVKMYGNIMSLIKGFDTDNLSVAQDILRNADEIPNEYCFYTLFYGQNLQRGNYSVYPAPYLDASNLIFPATKLKSYCYMNLFNQYCGQQGSTGGLIDGPTFLATDFVDENSKVTTDAFRSAFLNCSYLTSIRVNFNTCPANASANLAYWLQGTNEALSSSSYYANKLVFAPDAFLNCANNNIPCETYGFKNSKKIAFSYPYSTPSPAAASADANEALTANIKKILYPLNPTTINGITYTPVDMGDGVAWADRNVGAATTDAVGDYFMWGRSDARTTGGVGTGSAYKLTVYGLTKSGDILPVSADIATMNIGSNWRMPTQADLVNLYESTTQAGRTFTNKADNSKSITIPASGYMNSGTSKQSTSAGHFWSSELDLYYGENSYWNSKAKGLSINNGNVQYSQTYIYCGMPVRAVYDPSVLDPTFKTHTLRIITGDYHIDFICQHGQTVTITAVPDYENCKAFRYWDDNHSNTTAERTFTVNDDATYTAVFWNDPDAVQYTATFYAADGETILDQDDYCEGQYIVYDGTTPVIAGYGFTGFSGFTAGTTQMGKTNVSFTATYVQLFTVTASATLGSVTITPNDPTDEVSTGVFKNGAQIELNVSPSAGQRFVRWTDGNTDNPRTVTVTGNATYTAEVDIESQDKTVRIYQSTTADTTKILYLLKSTTVGGITYRPVDMGYGVAWANKNIGASDSTMVGTYFYWGDIEGHSSFSSSRHIDITSFSSGKELASGQDAAYQLIGTSWSIPSFDEFRALIGNTKKADNKKFTSYSNNDNHIIIPAGGVNKKNSISNGDYQYYWTKTFASKTGSGSGVSYNFIRRGDNYYTVLPYLIDSTSLSYYYYGMPIRAIYKPYDTYKLTINVGSNKYVYVCQPGQRVTVTAVANTAANQVFKWWKDNQNTDATRVFTMTADLEVEAVFQFNPSIPHGTATFKDWDNTQLAQVEVAAGSEPVYSGATPTRVGYTFTGWSPAITAMTDGGNVIYTATYSCESADAFVDVYQNVSSNSTKILYYLPVEKEFNDGNKYSAIDMGYGVAWADRNVGATEKNAQGGWYQWGGETPDQTANVAANNIPSTGGKSTSSSDALTDLEDVAKTTMGANWHMPNRAEWNALKDNTDISGSMFTNRTDNLQTITLQTGGYYYCQQVCIEQWYGYCFQYDYQTNNDKGDYCMYWVNERSAGDAVYLFHNTSGVFGVYATDDGNSGFDISPKYVMQIRAIYEPSYTTYTLTINVGSYSYQYICQAGQSITVTANATTSGNVFDKWLLADGSTPDDVDGTLATRTFVMTENITRTATFKEVPTGSTVSIFADNTGYGSVDVATINNVPDNKPITVNSNTLTINNTTVTATVTESNTAQYTYSFAGWTDSEGNVLPATVTNDITIRANFKREIHLVLVQNGTNDHYDNFADEFDGKTANTVTLNRQFEQGRWSTLCLPFEVSGGMMTTLKMSGRVYEFKYATGNANVGEGVNLYFSNAKKMEAGKGYIVNADAKLAEKTSFVFSNVKIDVSKDLGKPLNSKEAYDNLSNANGYKTKGDIALVGTLRNGTLKGVSKDSQEGNTYMGLKSNKIYYPNISQGSTIWAYRGIFHSSKALDIKNMQKMRIIVDGEDMGELFIDEDGEILDASGNAESRKFIENGVLYIEREGVVYDAQGKRVESSF